MNAATLFSGIGSPEVACPEIDWRWCAEIEAFPSAVMAERHPGIPNLGDVTAEDFIERAQAHGAIDLLVFGSPCQSFSVAGRRLGLDDPRGNLALVALGIVAELAPRWFVFENVPGLFSSWSGGEENQPSSEQSQAIADGSLVEGEWEWTESNDFASFIQWVDDIGYCGAWAVLDAQWFGVAQRRRRVFFVGHSGDWRGPAAVLLEPDSVCGHLAPSREEGKRVAPTIEGRAGRSGANNFATSGGLIENVSDTVRSHPRPGSNSTGLLAYGGNRTAGPTDVATACNAHPSPHGRLDFETETFVAHTFQNTGQGWWNEGEVAQPIRTPEGSGSMEANIVAHALRADGFDASEDGTGRGTPLVTAFSSKDHGADAGETAPTLRAMPHDGSHANAGGQVAVAFTERTRSDGRALEHQENIAYALDNPGDGGRTQTRTIQAGMAVRRLTPVECERLQGFQDGYTGITYRGKPAADGPRYKALGNAMAVPVIRWILRRVGRASQIREEV